MKNRKKNTKLVLLLLLVCITLGYAALRTGLNINGTANVASSSWNVYFSNYQMSNATNITPTTEPVITGTTTTSISYEVDLDVPGDIYEFSVEVVNGGSLDANISLVSKYNGAEIGPTNPVPEYITYTVTDGNGNPIVDNHRLNHGARETVRVYIKYKDDDPSVLPGTDAPGLSFDIEIEATKAEKETEHSVYTLSKIYEEYSTHIGQTIPVNTASFQTPASAMAHWAELGYDDVDLVCLRHVLNGNNEIVKSYPVFLITDEMAQANEGVEAGIYELDYDYTYEELIAIIQGIFGYTTDNSRCTDHNSGDLYSCTIFDDMKSVSAYIYPPNEPTDKVTVSVSDHLTGDCAVEGIYGSSCSYS